MILMAAAPTPLPLMGRGLPSRKVPFPQQKLPFPQQKPRGGTCKAAVQLQAAGRPGSDRTEAEKAVLRTKELLLVSGVDTSEPRVALAFAVGEMAARRIEKGLQSVVGEVARYTLGARREDEPGSWEEALMTVPNLETIPSRLLDRVNLVNGVNGVNRVGWLEIREVGSYLVAETTMASQAKGFDFMGSSRAFNTLAEYLFGKNQARAAMDMTTPVVSQQGQPMEMTTPVISQRTRGQAMEMTTPVLNSKEGAKGAWTMSFVIPSEYNEDTVPLPKDSSVTIRRIPARTVAVSVFSGYVTDEDVKRREQALRGAIALLPGYSVAPGAEIEVAQYNPPFTPPFMRRNEVSLEIISKA